MMKRFRFFTLAALLVLPLAACDEGDDSVTPGADGTVTGTVSIDGTGEAGVTVALSSGQTTTTGTGGTYTFNDVAVGSYTVTISGFPSDAAFTETTKAAVVATAGQVVTVDFAGSRITSSSIFGSVTSGTAPLAGVTVTLSGAASRTATTDADGEFSVSGLPAGTFTVTISGIPAGQACATTSQSVTLTAGESKVASFACTPTATAGISGILFLDENNKNDLFDGPALEDTLKVSNVAITLEGPTVGVTNTDQTDDGAFSFPDLPAGSYNVTIDATDPDIPDGVSYGGASATFTVELAAGGSAAVNFPFDLLSQTVDVFAFLGRHPSNTMFSTTLPSRVAPLPGVEISLWPSVEAIDGGDPADRFGIATTDAEGRASFTFLRADDTSPSGGPPDNIVFALYESGPDAFHELDGNDVIEIRYDTRQPIFEAEPAFNLLNRRVVVEMDAKGAGSGEPLVGWDASIWTDTTAASIATATTDAEGKAVFDYSVAAAADLPDTLFLRLESAQAAAAGHAFTTTLAPERATVVGPPPYLRYVFQGTVVWGDTVDVGDELVTFADADVFVRVHHEADDSITTSPEMTLGDNFDGVANVLVGLSWRQSGAVTDSVRAEQAPDPATGAVTFPNVPTGQAPYVLTSRTTVGTQFMLEEDTLFNVGASGGTGDMSGSSATIRICPLGPNTAAECSTFAHKYENTSITGTVLAADGVTPAEGIRVRVLAHPRTIQPRPTDTTVTVDAGGAFSVTGMREGLYIASILHDSVTAAGDSIWAFFGNTADTVDLQGSADSEAVAFVATRMDTQIQGVVVNDRDVDLNTVDPGEALSGVTVELYIDNSGTVTLNPDSLVATTSTNASGAYTFTGLREGTYAVKVLQNVANAVVLRRYTTLGAIVDTAHVHTAAAESAVPNVDNARIVGSTSPNPLPRWDYTMSAALNTSPSHFTFLFSSGTVTGRVSTAVGDTSVVGMTMTLTRCDDSAAPSPPAAGNCSASYFPGFMPINQNTNAGGTFTFTGLEEGVYEVRSNPATVGRPSTTPSSMLFTISGANDVETGNFTTPTP